MSSCTNSYRLSIKVLFAANQICLNNESHSYLMCVQQQKKSPSLNDNLPNIVYNFRLRQYIKFLHPYLSPGKFYLLFTDLWKLILINICKSAHHKLKGNTIKLFILDQCHCTNSNHSFHTCCGFVLAIPMINVISPEDPPQYYQITSINCHNNPISMAELVPCVNLCNTTTDKEYFYINYLQYKMLTLFKTKHSCFLLLNQLRTLYNRTNSIDNNLLMAEQSRPRVGSNGSTGSPSRRFGDNIIDEINDIANKLQYTILHPPLKRLAMIVRKHFISRPPIPPRPNILCRD